MIRKVLIVILTTLAVAALVLATLSFLTPVWWDSTPTDYAWRALEVDEGTKRTSRRVEAELATWTPTCEEAYAPPVEVRHPTMDICGTWTARGGHDSGRLDISVDEYGVYQVLFVASGDLGRWRLEREGDYCDGVLRLNRPIREYMPLTYTRLYAIRLDGEDRLFISACPDDIRPILDEGEPTETRVGKMFLMYKRGAPR